MSILLNGRAMSRRAAFPLYGKLACCGLLLLLPSLSPRALAAPAVAAQAKPSLMGSLNVHGAMLVTWRNLPRRSAPYVLEQLNRNDNWYPVLEISDPAQGSFTVTGLLPKEQPAFRVRLADSADAFLIAPDVGPKMFPPTEIKITNGEENGEIDVSWKNNSPDALYNNVYLSEDGVHQKLLATVSMPGTSYRALGLIPGRSYSFALEPNNN